MNKIPDISENHYAEIFLSGESEGMTLPKGIFKKVGEGKAQTIEVLHGFSYKGGELIYEGKQSKTFQGILMADISHQADGARQIHVKVMKNSEVIAETIKPASQLITHKFTMGFEEIISPGDKITVQVNMQGIYSVRIKDLKLTLISKQ